MAYGDFKDLPRRTGSDKILCDKDPKYDGSQRGLALMVYKRFDKKTPFGGSIKSKIMSNRELAEELQIPIIKKFEKRKVH